MALSSEAVAQVKSAFQAACDDTDKGVPGLVGIAVGKDGQELFAHAAGKRGFGSKEPMTLDNIFWIASCTKMITGVACMQLVEQGKLSLDDAEQVAKLCPEIKNPSILQPDGTLQPAKKRITLRMLLSHTAGFGYTFFHQGLRDYSKPVGYDEFSGHLKDMVQPLVHEPGEGWQYGLNIDWAGFCVERTTNMTLNEYFQRHIFQPLNIKNISMFPNNEMKTKLAYMNARTLDGQLHPRDHLLHAPLVVETEQEMAACVNSGGAGAFASPREYCQILATLLNDGTSPNTGARILKKETVDMMFDNQIPDFPNFGKQGIPDAKSDLTNAIPDLYPGSQQGWGLTFMLSDGPTGRSSGTGHWAGLPNLYWWCDRAQGVAGMICSQILPFADPKVLGLWVELESGVYSGLGKKS
ncbi:beta-lactamase family protein [Exophiala viscosa]|uniref:Beta-lactamase family protein n=1 Tax=Exophiala viscosa TaxID=2486360 RepID=A0AAN6E2T8_9EURO|nr:beta-lactamase family protein [Exophiala viscosa]KAI1619591.1 beta-lactamase family protein [Exophiala viscosa]